MLLSLLTTFVHLNLSFSTLSGVDPVVGTSSKAIESLVSFGIAIDLFPYGEDIEVSVNIIIACEGKRINMRRKITFYLVCTFATLELEIVLQDSIPDF